MKTKKFHLGDVLTVTTGQLLSLNNQGVLDILSFMTGDNVFVHAIPRVADECRPYLLEQFPQLAGVDASGVNGRNHKRWLAEQVTKYGEEFEVKPLPKGAHQFKNPIVELTEMVDEPEKLIFAKTD